MLNAAILNGLWSNTKNIFLLKCMQWCTAEGITKLSRHWLETEEEEGRKGRINKEREREKKKKERRKEREKERKKLLSVTRRREKDNRPGGPPCMPVCITIPSFPREIYSPLFFLPLTSFTSLLQN